MTAASAFHRIRSVAYTVRLFELKASFWIVGISLILIVSGWFWARTPVHELTRSEFIQQVDRKNVHDAKFEMAGFITDIYGDLSEPAEPFHASIQTEDIHDIAYRLQQTGVPTTSAEAIPKGSLKYYATAIGLVLAAVLIISAWFILTRKRIRELEGKAQTLASVQRK